MFVRKRIVLLYHLVSKDSQPVATLVHCKPRRQTAQPCARLVAARTDARSEKLSNTPESLQKSSLENGGTIRVKKKNVEAMIQQDSAMSCVGAGALKFASGE